MRLAPQGRRGRRRRGRRAIRGRSATTPRRCESLQSGEVDVLGGTAWLWARPEFADAVDVLFVDEAGQMSLANVLAVSGAANSIVLLGDPQQLEQPQKGTHPDGVDASALRAHPRAITRRSRPTAASSCPRPGAWRRASARSRPRCSTRAGCTSTPGLERQALAGASGLDGSGLCGRRRRARRQPQRVGRGGRGRRARSSRA